MHNDGLYYIWNKGERAQLSSNFDTSEFACQCSYPDCIEQRISVRLIKKLQKVRDKLSYGLKISSGYRCGRHQSDLLNNQAVKTVSKSTHTLGHAADLHPTAIGSGQMGFVLHLLSLEFRAIGLASTWFHVDLRSDKERRWKYV